MSESLLRRERLLRGLTQAALAESLGVSQQTVARWETGQTPPSRYLRELASLLELPVAELLQQPRKGRSRSRLRISQAGAVPFGTVRLDVIPLPEEEWRSAADRAAATEWTAYEFPISDTTRQSLSAQLARRDGGSGWLWFASLDNRIVFANLQLLEAVALISSNLEQMPSYEPPEVYEAILEPEMQQLLGPTPPDTTDYPDELIAACSSYVQSAGGLDDAVDREYQLLIETARGFRDLLPLDADGATARDLRALLHALNEASTHETSIASLDDWLLNLYADRPDRATHYRLGALALIDAPARAIRATA